MRSDPYPLDFGPRLHGLLEERQKIEYISDTRG